MSLNNLFDSIFQSTAATTSSITASQFILCIVVGLVVGIIIALTYTYKTKFTKSFVVTLAVLPAVVGMVILMVNGNLGAGVAVAWTFSLVRFRSVPGTAKEIGVIFLAMGAGLAVGMGYLGYAVLFSIIMSAVGMAYSFSKIGNRKPTERTLKITIPEDLDYSKVFDDIMLKYTSDSKLVSVKTSNMGSLFKLTYDITLKAENNEKTFIDELRTRNGNLEIVSSLQSTIPSEL